MPPYVSAQAHGWNGIEKNALVLRAIKFMQVVNRHDSGRLQWDENGIMRIRNPWKWDPV